MQVNEQMTMNVNDLYYMKGLTEGMQLQQTKQIQQGKFSRPKAWTMQEPMFRRIAYKSYKPTYKTATFVKPRLSKYTET